MKPDFQEKNLEKSVKVIIAGELGEVGQNFLKTKMFHQDSLMTIGVEFYSETCNLLNLQLKGKFWFLTSRKKFREIIPTYFRGTKVMILVKGNNQSITDYFLNLAKEKNIMPNQIILIDRKNFSEKALEFAVVVGFYNRGAMSDLEFKSYKKTLSPKINLLSEVEEKIQV